MKNMKGLTIFAILLLICLTAGCGTKGAGTSSVAKSKYPEKAIEVVVPFAPGGGSALTAQIFSRIMTEEKIIPVNMNLTYKPGGSSAVGMGYTAGQRENPYTLMLFTPTIVTTPLMGDVKVSINDFQVICVFGYEVSMLCANPKGKFKTFDDVIKYAKENPGKLTISGAGTGGAQHMYATKLAKIAGFEYTFVPYSGSSEASTALLGNHVDLAVIHLNEGTNYLEAGQVIPLGIGSEKRVATFPNIPTFIEQGYNFSYQMARGVVAPAGIPDDAKKALAEAFKKLCEHPRWDSDFVKKFNFISDPKYLDDARDFMLQQRDSYAEILKLAGVI